MENLISQQRSKSQISNSTFFQIICFFCIICRTLSLLYFIFIYILHHISYGIIATFHYFMNPPSKLTMSVLLLPPKAFIKSLVKTESLLKKHYNPLHPGSSLPHSDPDVIQLSKETQSILEFCTIWGWFEWQRTNFDGFQFVCLGHFNWTASKI